MSVYVHMHTCAHISYIRKHMHIKDNGNIMFRYDFEPHI